MKNQESIFDIKHDIAVLKNNIRIRTMLLEDYCNLNLQTTYQKNNKYDKKIIKKLEKTVQKLENQDQKTWRQCLQIARKKK